MTSARTCASRSRTAPIPATSTAIRTRKPTVRSIGRAASPRCGRARIGSICSATFTSPSAASAAPSATCSPTCRRAPRLPEGISTPWPARWKRMRGRWRPYRFARLYIGGGTPTYLDAVELRRLIGLLRRFGVDPSAAHGCIETSPETIDEEKTAILRQAGFQRISLGVQSLVAEELRQVNRRFDFDLHRQAINRIGEAGFPHFNIDLIYGLPGQTERSWRLFPRRRHRLAGNQSVPLSAVRPPADGPGRQAAHLAHRPHDAADGGPVRRRGRAPGAGRLPAVDHAAIPPRPGRGRDGRRVSLSAARHGRPGGGGAELHDASALLHPVADGRPQHPRRGRGLPAAHDGGPHGGDARLPSRRRRAAAAVHHSIPVVRWAGCEGVRLDLPRGRSRAALRKCGRRCGRKNASATRERFSA